MRVDLRGNRALSNAAFPNDQEGTVTLGNAGNRTLNLRRDRREWPRGVKRLPLSLQALNGCAGCHEVFWVHARLLARRVPNRAEVVECAFHEAYPLLDTHLGRSCARKVEKVFLFSGLNYGINFPLEWKYFVIFEGMFAARAGQFDGNLSDWAVPASAFRLLRRV